MAMQDLYQGTWLVISYIKSMVAENEVRVDKIVSVLLI